jgi:hypothetical protein
MRATAASSSRSGRPHTGLQEGVRELAADDRADLDHFLGAPEAIEARHERVLQRRGNVADRASVEDEPRQLLDEERHAVRALRDRRRRPRRAACPSRAMAEIICRVCRRPRRLSITCAWCERSGHGGTELGRAV